MSNPQSRVNKDFNLFNKDTVPVDTYGVCRQLAPEAETVSTDRLLSQNNLEQTIQSEGVHEPVHLEEGRNVRTSEGASIDAGHMNTNAEKDLSNIVKQNIVTSKRSKSSSHVLYDIKKPTMKTDIRQRMSKRKRKQAKVWKAISAVHKLAKKIHKHKHPRHKVSANSFINQFANLACIANGELNDIHPLAFAAGGYGPNPNILNHKQSMEASDHEKFELAMTEEMDNLVKK